MTEEPLKQTFPDPVKVEEKEELLTFEYVWENFVAQLNAKRAELQEKEEEIEDEKRRIWQALDSERQMKEESLARFNAET